MGVGIGIDNRVKARFKFALYCVLSYSPVDVLYCFTANVYLCFTCAAQFEQNFFLELVCIHCKKGYRFSRLQPGCHLPNSPWRGIIKLFPARREFGKGHPGWGRENGLPFFTVYFILIFYIQKKSLDDNVCLSVKGCILMDAEVILLRAFSE
jgi:hypothetical protein